jgi:N-acetylmuramoyl-L-alanine amidase
MGAAMPEKALNLVNAQKLAARLTQLGANVTMTRDTDVFHTLQARVEMSRRVNPDMFISMHANSVAETTDATAIHGITFWYRNPNAKPIADLFTAELYSINPYTNRRRVSNHANFYVVRPSWTPSVLVEASFLCNIDDFVWLLREENQELLADRLVEAILLYYGK